MPNAPARARQDAIRRTGAGCRSSGVVGYVGFVDHRGHFVTWSSRAIL